ncbi:saccharopine dehydrogenase NADP-binding domain-containing protein [Deferribacteraceae bacterium V6Fe1]|nr:saccharopine dehydrogenase NADP-binding domain-containing protein [Deferribacteraceae bacterium V6Fe1]
MNGKKVLQLGYGMQGKAVLYDLIKNDCISKVILADISSEISKLQEIYGKEKLEVVLLDASDFESIKKLMEKVDIVAEVLPGPFALPVAKLASEVGVSLVSSMYLVNPGEQDISKRKKQMYEVEQINKISKSKNITILQEFGMDPGIDLVLTKNVIDKLDTVEALHSYGAGFPERESAETSPLLYKFTWSVIGVMRSYLRPAKYIKNNDVVNVQADEVFLPEHTHTLNIESLKDYLECFPNGDSVHYADLLGIKNNVKSMGRYICRWPGHASFWSKMAKCGFLNEDPIDCNGLKVSPVQFCASLLGNNSKFFYGENERDVALIRVDARGFKNNKPVRFINQIIDKRDLETGFTSMQRTVGFTVSIGVQMILDGRISKSGVLTPFDVPFEDFMSELGKRNIVLDSFEEKWDGSLEP